MSGPERELVLNKGSHQYVFRYRQGEEDGVLATLARHADDTRTDFDWFDAELLRLKITEIEQESRPKPSERSRVHVERG